MSVRVVVKKKGGHSGHHGGAWKVAYADFVTAMMALFIVLWLMNSSKQVQEAVGGYFKDPTGTAKMVGSDMHGSGENFLVSKENMAKLKEELQKTIRKVSNFEKLNKQIEMTVTAEGLRIELMEDEKGTFFELGSPQPSDSCNELLKALAQEIGKLPNQVSIEGHTDSRPYGKDSYSNWELSVDRANAARRLMQAGGLTAEQISQVRGYSDRRLRYKDSSEDPRNRRISLIVQYLNGNGEMPDGSTPASVKSGIKTTKTLGADEHANALNADAGVKEMPR
jgi:chemotaxis protein MotB